MLKNLNKYINFDFRTHKYLFILNYKCPCINYKFYIIGNPSSISVIVELVNYIIKAVNTF